MKSLNKVITTIEYSSLVTFNIQMDFVSCEAKHHQSYVLILLRIVEIYQSKAPLNNQL